MKIDIHVKFNSNWYINVLEYEPNRSKCSTAICKKFKEISDVIEISSARELNDKSCRCKCSYSLSTPSCVQLISPVQFPESAVNSVDISA